MKLVDILARELKVWPEGVSVLSQLRHNGAIINGKGYDGREWDRLQIAEDTLPAGVLVSEGQWQAAVDALSGIPKFPSDDVEWTGEGLPPVGAVCEAIDLVFPAVGGGGASIFGGGGGSAGEVWIPCTVIAHTLVYGKESAVVNSERKVGWSPLPNQFRPIRTPEQIAAEERESGIVEMCELFMRNKVDAIRVVDCCERLYDAGCRMPGKGAKA